MTDIQTRLFSMADEKYKSFSAPLIPSVSPERIIGIPLPAIRKYAAELSGTREAESFLTSLPHFYLEENHLHGFLTERTADFDRCVSLLDIFLPFVDNWATCDSIRPPVFKKNLPRLLPHIRRWLDAPDTYTRRFAIEMLMCHYLEEGVFSPEYPLLVSTVEPGEYYLEMMAAWYFATALAKQWEAVFPFIEQKRLAPAIHNRAIRKATESRRISPEQKLLLKTLRLPG